MTMDRSSRSRSYTPSSPPDSTSNADENITVSDSEESPSFNLETTSPETYINVPRRRRTARMSTGALRNNRPRNNPYVILENRISRLESIIDELFNILKDMRRLHKQESKSNPDTAVFLYVLYSKFEFFFIVLFSRKEI